MSALTVSLRALLMGSLISVDIYKLSERLCLGNNWRERRIVGILIRFPTNYSWSKSSWKSLILPARWKTLGCKMGNSRDSLAEMAQGAHTHAHSHNIYIYINTMELVLCISSQHSSWALSTLSAETVLAVQPISCLFLTPNCKFLIIPNPLIKGLVS